jgi:hypothetical protein
MDTMSGDLFQPETRQIRFGAYVQELSLHQRLLSYNVLAPEIRKDAIGNDVPYRPQRLQLRPIDYYRLSQPYLSIRLWDQFRAVAPLAVYLFLFQLLILKQSVADAGTIGLGLAAVMFGLMLFMEGLKVGLMPFAEAIGHSLPQKSTLPVVLTVTFLLGIGVTLAEPAIGALKIAGSSVDVHKAPYLYAMLNQWSWALVLTIGIGVGAAAVLGTLRFLHGWSLKPLIFVTLVPTLGITGFVMADPDLRMILGVAWDSGGITTGPVTVPLVLALGIGISAAAGNGRSSLSGFGIVTLASLIPVLGVMLLGMVLAEAIPAADIIAQSSAATAGTAPAWYELTPWADILMGLRALLPLIAFLYVVLRLLLNERVRNRTATIYGLILCIAGMCMFNVGLSYGLVKLGGQSGGMVPAAFMEVGMVPGSPLYALTLGLTIAFLFSWLLGYGATLAEPALNALGFTVENLTNGAFKKSMLMHAVSVGVATGIGLGVLKIVFNWPLGWLLIPGYAIALLLTVVSTEEFVNIGWDSAGVTTGPVTVPLVLAIGLGFGQAVGAVEGFGMLALASVCPIITVLATGVWVQWKIRRRHAAAENDVAATEAAGA